MFDMDMKSMYIIVRVVMNMYSKIEIGKKNVELISFNDPLSVKSMKASKQTTLTNSIPHNFFVTEYIIYLSILPASLYMY